FTAAIRQNAKEPAAAKVLNRVLDLTHAHRAYDGLIAELVACTKTKRHACSEDRHRFPTTNSALRRCTPSRWRALLPTTNMSYPTERAGTWRRWCGACGAHR